MTFFTDCCASGTFSLLVSQCVFTPWTVFSTQAGSVRPMFNRLVNIFLTKTWFFIHITHSSVNFSWFALLIQIILLLFKKILLIYWMCLINIIGHSSVKKKNPLICWMIFVCLIDPSSVKKIPFFIEWTSDI